MSKSNKKTDPVLVFIYANWCPHCQTMIPHWDNAKTDLENKIHIHEIEDAMLKTPMLNNPEQRFLKDNNIELQGFPTLILHKDGINHQYGGAQECNAIVNWVNGLLVNKGGYKLKSIMKSKSKSKTKRKSKSKRKTKRKKSVRFSKQTRSIKQTA